MIIRYFLAVARSPTARVAAERLAVNHSTVLRRIAQLEERLGTLLFEKLPSGYRVTAAGNEVLSTAEEMEASSNRFEALILGRDQTVGVSLRVTLPPTLMTYLLAPDVARFARLYSDVEIDVFVSNEPVNLTNREADVAIRVVYDRDTLPLNLYGSKGPELHGGVYVARDLLDAWRSGSADPVRWIVKDNYGIPDWARVAGIPIAEVPSNTET
jgi:DNA-binding transcriptional LysR family regulator